MSNWRTCTIGDLVKEEVILPPMDGNHGEIHPKGNDFVSEGIPFVMASDINDSLIDLVGCKYISKKQAEGLRKGFAHEGDVLLTHKATIGRTAVVPHTKYPYLMLTPQVTYYRVINSSALNNRFLKYYLDYKPFQETLGLWAGAGSTRAYLGITGQHNLTIRIPDIDTQQKIAAVLAAIDKKIELNNRINAELEAMAKTLYDYWFVQFDFPVDSPQGQGKPYKTSGGKMIYSPALKREIPEGWEDSTIGEIEPNIVTGKTPSKDNSEYFGGNVPFITIGDIRGNTYIVSTEETLTASGAATQKNKFLPEDSICVTCIASPGLVGFVTTPAQTNQQINSVVCSNEINKYYLYFAIKGYFEGAKAKTGNTFSNMNKGDFSAIVILKPSDQALQDYHQKAYPLFEKIKLKSLENKQLVELRDWLLPMLMNGQVTVGRAS